MNEDKRAASRMKRSWLRNATPWVSAVRSGMIQSRSVTNGAIIDAVMDRSPKRVLDLGCGEGWLLRVLSESGVACVGIDHSPPLIDAARRAGAGTYYCLSYADFARSAPEFEDRFDVAIANFSLLDGEVNSLLGSIRSLLNPDGAVIIQTLHPMATAREPYEDGWRTENFGSLDGEWQPMPWYFRTLATWVREIREAGYTLSALHEPRSAENHVPLSMLMVAEPVVLGTV